MPSRGRHTRDSCLVLAATARPPPELHIQGAPGDDRQPVRRLLGEEVHEGEVAATPLQLAWQETQALVLRGRWVLEPVVMCVRYIVCSTWHIDACLPGGKGGGGGGELLWDGGRPGGFVVAGLSGVQWDMGGTQQEGVWCCCR